MRTPVGRVPLPIDGLSQAPDGAREGEFPGDYFRGMLARHSAGELSLARTVWRLRQAIDRERYASDGSPHTAGGNIL